MTDYEAELRVLKAAIFKDADRSLSLSDPRAVLEAAQRLYAASSSLTVIAADARAERYRKRQQGLALLDAQGVSYHRAQEIMRTDEFQITLQSVEARATAFAEEARGYASVALLRVHRMGVGSTIGTLGEPSQWEVLDRLNTKEGGS